MLKYASAWSLILLFATLAAQRAIAQQGTGVILGTVTDSSGAAVPGATVTVANTGTNFTVTVSTGAQGEYITPPLSVGEYRVTVDRTGFKSVVRTGIVLQVDDRGEVDFRLGVGSVRQVVEVTGAAPLVNTSNATIGDVIGNKAITNLPLDGRNTLALMFLSPNVTSEAGPTNSGFADRGTVLSAVSINGAVSGIDSLLLDGVDNNQSYLGDLNVNPAVDAVQEFKVQSGAMSAEFGFTLGGVVNMVTKSGTNQFHGSLYEFVRNNDFDARNAFATTVAPYHYNQYGGSIGGPIWVPRLYDGHSRSFFFYNIEQYHYNYVVNAINTMPTLAERTGDFSNLRGTNGALIPIYNPASTRPNPSGSGYIRDPFPNNIIPPSLIDPVALNVMNLLIPTPNQAPTNVLTQANNYMSANAVKQSMNQFTLRLDQRFSDKNSGFGRYVYYTPITNYGNGVALDTPLWSYRHDDYENWNLALGDTHTFTTMLFNEFRLGVLRNNFPYTTASYGQHIVRTIGLPASVPDVEIPGFSIPGIPSPDDIFGFRGGTTWELNDFITRVHGSHTITLGADFRLEQGNNLQEQYPSGNFTFAATLTGNPLSQAGTGYGIATFLTGATSAASGATYEGEAEKGHSASFFVQDDWRMKRSFTLNLGLRYDYQPWAMERNNGIANFLPNEANPLNGLQGRLGFAGVDFQGSPLGATPTPWGPRVGFAWDIAGSGKTVIRGGYGIYYETNMIRDLFGNTQGFATTTTTYNPPGGNSNLPVLYLHNGFPTPLTPPLGRALGPSGFLGQTIGYDMPNAKLPTAQQWDFSVQRQLPGRWVVEVAYAGNHGTHMISWTYNDAMNPQYLSLGNALLNQVPNPYAGIVPGTLGAATISQMQLLKPYPYYSTVQIRNPHRGDSIYHAGIVTVQRQLSNDFVLLAAYTKSKLITDNTLSPIDYGSTDASINGGAISVVQNVYDWRAERSRDPIDVPQRFVLSSVYALPIGKGKPLDFSSSALNHILGGWQTQGILTIQTGTPVAITGANNQGIATRPNITSQAKLSHPSRNEWFNTGVFVDPPNWTFGDVGRTLPNVNGPGTVNLDSSVIKSVSFRERYVAEVRLEAFNVANHVNLMMPNSAFVPGTDGLNDSSTFGTIISARSARVLQLAVRLSF